MTKTRSSYGTTILASAGQGCNLHGRYKLPSGGALNVLSKPANGRVEPYRCSLIVRSQPFPCGQLIR